MLRFPRLLALCAILSTGASTSALGQTQTCEPALAETYLNTNNVRARILNNGSLFWRGQPSAYTVPQDGPANAIFSSSVLMGGYVDGSLRVAGSTYGPYEFWAGPFEEVAEGSNCADFDRIYDISRRDFNTLKNGLEPSLSMVNWPYQHGAPVVDGDGIPDNYDLSAGDRPQLLGSQSAFWIMNDIGNTHNQFDTAPLGVEVHGTAFAAASTNPDFDNTTFYRYRIINKNSVPIEGFTFGIYVDVDLGNFDDDYVGVDTFLDMAYAYNSDNYDEGGEGYGWAPPAVGYVVLQGLKANTDGIDNNGDGQVDEAEEQIGLTSFVYFTNGSGVTGSPQSGGDLYNYMQGRWKDGQRVTLGGNGRDFSNIPTSFMYSGRPPDFWSELNSDGQGTQISPADRRFLASIGPVDLAAGEETELFFAIVTAFGRDNLDSVDKLRTAALRLRGLTPEQVTSDIKLPPPPNEIPTLLSPADGVSGVAGSVELVWDIVTNETEFRVQTWATETPSAVSDFTVTGLSTAPGFALNTTYSFRVRAQNDGAFGPWSDVSTFTTGSIDFIGENPIEAFLATANAAGPIEPPMGAAADWQQFPVPGRPDQNQQVGDGIWLIHTGSDGSRPAFSHFLSRSVRFGYEAILPDSYEIRFSGSSLFYDRFGVSGGGIQPGDIPFELWSIGQDLNDPADDVRLIAAAIDWENDGWGIRSQDHEVSDGSDDPETDWVYWFHPNDRTPGTSGYDSWAASVQAGGDPTDHGEEIFSRIVFVNLDGGDTTVSPPLFNQELPEPGSVFRIVTSMVPEPILASPADQLNTVTGVTPFFWTAFSQEGVVLELASDPAFDSIIHRIENAVPGIGVDLAEGNWYWRVSDPLAGPSLVWTLSVSGDSPPDPSLPEFSLTLEVSDGTSDETLTFGVLPGFTDGFDTPVDQLAPPAPPGGTFDARLISPVDNFLMDHRDNALLEASWIVKWQLGSGAGPVALSWSPVALPADGSFKLSDNLGGLVFAEVNMRSVDRWSPSTTAEGSLNQLRITFSATKSLDMTVDAGWNLVGLPLSAPVAKTEVFPSALDDSFFRFDGSYTRPDGGLMHPGEGYWLRFAGAGSTTVESFFDVFTEISVDEGWQIISPPNCVIPTGVVADPSNALLPGTLFGFDDGYFAASSLSPGSGYWVRAVGPGTITLNCGSVPAGKNASDSQFDSFVHLGVQDAAGARASLYVGGSLPEGTSDLAFTAPPAGPISRWVPAFSDGRYVAEGGSALLDLSGAVLPVILSAEDTESIHVTVLDARGSVIGSQSVQSGTTMTIDHPAASALRLGSEGDLPTVFTLDQNYPNPFNPVTSIRFGLPEDGVLSLYVFDLLGRRVVTLLDSEARSAGWHTIHFDASSFASGTYFYQISTESSVLSKRMVLVK